jgi:hypothetical protein
MDSLSSLLGASSGRGWRRRPADIEGSWEYIEYSVADRRQVVVLRIRGWMEQIAPHYNKRVCCKKRAPSVTMRDGQRLAMRRRCCGETKREKITARWRKSHIEDFLNMYFSTNMRLIKSIALWWLGHVVCMGLMKTRKEFDCKPEANRPVGRHKRRWEDIIKIYLKDIRYEVLDSFRLECAGALLSTRKLLDL